MRRKPVPPAASLDRLAEVQAALPLVPGAVEDCCQRLQDRAGVPDRERAQTWLPFLAALGLANERDEKYYRARNDPEREQLAQQFQANVYGASEMLEAVDGKAANASTVFEATRDVVPKWERNRDPAWEQTWRERTERLLEWAAVFGLLEQDGERYRLTR